MSLILGSRRPAADRPETEITNLERCPIFSGGTLASLGDSQEISARKTRKRVPTSLAIICSAIMRRRHAVGGEFWRIRALRIPPRRDALYFSARAPK